MRNEPKRPTACPCDATKSAPKKAAWPVSWTKAAMQPLPLRRREPNSQCLLEVNVATRRDIEELDKSLQLEMRLLEQRLVMKLGSLVAVTIGVVAALVKLL